MDNSLIHADLFFYVTTFVVVFVGAALVVVLVYLAKVLSDIKEITGHVKEEAVLVREDIQGLRDDIRKNGFGIERTWMFAKNLFKKRRGNGRSSRSK